jgi:hypothetical protein
MRRNDSMKVCFRASILVIGLAGWIAIATAGAQGQARSATYDLAVSQTAPTTCSAGEPVALNGRMQFEASVSTVTDTTTSPPTVIYTYQTSIASDLSGVGQTTGTNYTASTAYSGGSQSTTSPARFTVVVRYGLDSQGSAPSLMLNQNLQLTVDDTGRIGATLLSNSTDCVDQPSEGDSQ